MPPSGTAAALAIASPTAGSRSNPPDRTPSTADDVEELADEVLVCGFDALGVPWRHLRAHALELPALDGQSSERNTKDDVCYGPLR